MKATAIARCVLITATCIGVMPVAHADGARSASQPMVIEAPEDAQPANGDVAELEALTRDGKVVALRKTLNGSYGASLSFYTESMIYYVALFQQSKIWRVFKTMNDARADAVYNDFVKSSATLADSEIRRIKLEAGKAFADKQIAVQQDRANRLQADIDIAHEQQSQVVTHQLEQEEAVRSLRTEQAAAQAQLKALQQRVIDLQRQSDGDFPASVPSPSPR
jgi:chromosome segregation ATPase